MTAEPFNERIVDFSHPIAYEEPVVMVRYDNSWSSGQLDVSNLLDQTSWVTFLVLFIYLILVIVLIDEQFLMRREAFFQRLSSVTLQMTGILLQQGKQ